MDLTEFSISLIILTENIIPRSDLSTLQLFCFHICFIHHELFLYFIFIFLLRPFRIVSSFLTWSEVCGVSEHVACLSSCSSLQKAPKSHFIVLICNKSEALLWILTLLLEVTPVSVCRLTAAFRYAPNCISKLLRTRIGYFCSCCNQLKGNSLIRALIISASVIASKAQSHMA